MTVKYSLQKVRMQTQFNFFSWQQEKTIAFLFDEEKNLFVDQKYKCGFLLKQEANIIYINCGYKLGVSCK